MSDDTRALRLYFDFISHNAYLAWTQIHDLAARHGRTVEPVPVLFAALLGAYGQLGPAEVPPKAWWMAKNVLRKATLLGVPLRPPASHPFLLKASGRGLAATSCSSKSAKAAAAWCTWPSRRNRSAAAWRSK